MKNSIHRIALIRLSALGDIVNTLMALYLIRQSYPHASITWYVDTRFAGVLEAHPWVDEVVALPLKAFKKVGNFPQLLRTWRSLRQHPPYDIIIDAQGLIKSSLVASAVRGTIRHGFDRHSAREGLAASVYSSTSAIPYERNVIVRNVELVCEALDIPFFHEKIDAKPPLFPHVDTSVIEARIVMVIGASWPSKRYPKEHFLTLAHSLPLPCFLIWGNEAEHNDAQWIADRSPNAHVAPAMRLLDLVGFIASSRLLIGNDTGPTHMAWAMNRPSITLFGPTNERMIYPTPIHRFLKSPSQVTILKINRHDFSIRDIDPHAVIDLALELLA